MKSIDRKPRFRGVAVQPDGSFRYQELSPGGDYYDVSAGFPLFLIREAWGRGADFEQEADGFGRGLGTMGDWSGIRDSSYEAKMAMLEKALNHLFKEVD